MALILGSLTLGDFPTTDQNLSNFTYFKNTGYVAPVSGTATAISMAVFSWGDVEGSQARVGLYDSGKNLLAHATISGTVGGFISGTLNTPVAITSGNTYYLAVMVTFGTMYPYQSGTWQTNVQSASGYPTLPATLGAGTGSATGSIGLALTGTVGTPQNLTDVNSGGNVSADSTGNTFTTTGFTQAITSATIGGLACTNLVEVAGNGTFSVPAPIDGAVYPEIGINQDVVVSGSTESATLSKPFVLNGYTRTVLSSPNIVDSTYFTANFDVTPLTNDLMFTVTADLTPSNDGGLTTDTTKTTIVLHWKRSTGVMYCYTFTINEAGVVGKQRGFIGLGFGIGLGF